MRPDEVLKPREREALAEMQSAIEAENSDLFDVLAYVAYTRAPVFREVRARHGQGWHQRQLQEQPATGVLDFVLGHYVDEGVDELDLDNRRRCCD